MNQKLLCERNPSQAKHQLEEVLELIQRRVNEILADTAHPRRREILRGEIAAMQGVHPSEVKFEDDNDPAVKKAYGDWLRKRYAQWSLRKKLKDQT